MSPIIFRFSSGFEVMHNILVTVVLDVGSFLSAGKVVVPYMNCFDALITATMFEILLFIYLLTNL